MGTPTHFSTLRSQIDSIHEAAANGFHYKPVILSAATTLIAALATLNYAGKTLTDCAIFCFLEDRDICPSLQKDAASTLLSLKATVVLAVCTFFGIIASRTFQYLPDIQEPPHEISHAQQELTKTEKAYEAKLEANRLEEEKLQKVVDALVEQKGRVTKSLEGLLEQLTPKNVRDSAALNPMALILNLTRDPE